MATIDLTAEELEDLASALVYKLAPSWQEDIDRAFEHRNGDTRIPEHLLESNVPFDDHADARNLLSWLNDMGILKDDYGAWDEDGLSELYRSWRLGRDA